MNEQNRKSGNRSGSHRGRDVAVDSALAVQALVGLVTNPAQPPNTDQLDDANTSQVKRYEQAIEDKSHKQGTETSQNK